MTAADIAAFESAPDTAARGGIAAGAMITSAVCLLALPSAVLAFTVNFEPHSQNMSQNQGSDILDSAQTSNTLARVFPIRSLAKGTPYPFTPAGSPTRPDRSVTVAVRVDAETAKGLTVRGPTRIAKSSQVELGIAPTAFNLGVSRGYSNFAQNIARKEDKPLSGNADLNKFSIAKQTTAGESRFHPRIVMDETKKSGRSPRTFAGDGSDLVDVGGSYRVTKNVDVTAGVRYSQERERLMPVTDGKQDNQAVYLGTQIRF